MRSRQPRPRKLLSHVILLPHWTLARQGRPPTCTNARFTRRKKPGVYCPTGLDCMFSGCTFSPCFGRGFQREYHRANPEENVSYLNVTCNRAQSDQTVYYLRYVTEGNMCFLQADIDSGIDVTLVNTWRCLQI